MIENITYKAFQCVFVTIKYLKISVNCSNIGGIGIFFVFKMYKDKKCI